MQTAQENITKHEGKRDGDWGLETKIELLYAVGFSWICQLVVYLFSALRQAQVLSLGTFIYVHLRFSWKACLLSIALLPFITP